MYTVPSDIFRTSLSQTSASSYSRKFRSFESNSESRSPEPLSPQSFSPKSHSTHSFSSTSLEQDSPLSLSAYHKPYRLSRKTTLYKVQANSRFVMEKAEKSFKNRVSSSKRKPAVAGKTSKFYDQISSHIKSNRLSSYTKFRRKYPEKSCRSRFHSKSTNLSKPPYLERCYTYTKFSPRRSMHSFRYKRKSSSVGSAKFRDSSDINSSTSSVSSNLSPARSSRSLSYKRSSTSPLPSSLHSIHTKSNNTRQPKLSASALTYKASTTKNAPNTNSIKTNRSEKDVDVRYLILPDIQNIIGKFVQAIKGKDSVVKTTPTQTELTLSNKKQDVAVHVVPCNTAEPGVTSHEDEILNELSDEELAEVNIHAKHMYDIIKFWLCKIPSHPNEKPQQATERATAVQQLMNDIISLENKKISEEKYIKLLEDAVTRFLDVVRIYDSGSQWCVSSAVKNSFKTYLFQKLLEENQKNEQQQINELTEEAKRVNWDLQKDDHNKIAQNDALSNSPKKNINELNSTYKNANYKSAGWNTSQSSRIDIDDLDTNCEHCDDSVRNMDNRQINRTPKKNNIIINSDFTGHTLYKLGSHNTYSTDTNYKNTEDMYHSSRINNNNAGNICHKEISNTSIIPYKQNNYNATKVYKNKVAIDQGLRKNTKTPDDLITKHRNIRRVVDPKDNKAQSDHPKEITNKPNKFYKQNTYADTNPKHKDDKNYHFRQINKKTRMKRTGHIGRPISFKEIFMEPKTANRDSRAVEDSLNLNSAKSYVAPKLTITSKPCLSGTISIFTSQHDMTPSFDIVTSTPRKKQHPTRLSPEQQAYTEKLIEVITEWVDASPPHFKYRQESENMNEVMVQDLAGEICDYVMNQQILGTHMDTDQMLSMYISKWLNKYDVVEGTEMIEPYISELFEKIKQITIPDMTRPQHGTRKDVEMMKRDRVTSFTDAYQPLVKVVLEDEISIFINEYPSEIFVNKDKSMRNKLVHRFAETIEPKLVNADTERLSGLEKEVYRWMHTIVEPREKYRVSNMADSLIERLKRIPHDETIAEYAKKTKEERQHIVRKNLGLKFSSEQGINASTTKQSQHDSLEDDYDKTMRQFLVDYIEHNHVEEDPLTKRVYANILRSELKRMSPDYLKNIYEAKKYVQFDSNKLFKEMLYIKEVSDWLRTIPVDSFYNTVKNEDRAEFVLTVARNLIEIDDEKEVTPNAMDYDSYTMHTIAALLRMVPILPTHYNIINSALQRLINRCALLRRNIIMQPTPPGQNIILFIEDFTERYGPEIANDKLKLEAWSARLFKELKSVIIEGDVKSKDTVEQRLLAVPKPGDESIRHFNLELNYAKEIVDWLKNVEIGASFDESYIDLLANKIADCDVQSSDENAKAIIVNDWVRHLNLNEDVDVPTLTQQLIKRIRKVSEESQNEDEVESDDISVKSNTDAVYSKLRDKTTPKSNCRGCCPVDDPGQVMVTIVEQWTDKISIKGMKNDVKEIKWDMTAKLERKLVELGDLYKENKSLYQQILAEEVDSLFQNLPEGIQIENNPDDLKNELVENVLDAYEFINEVSEGDNYRKKLESSLEKSLPNPALSHEDTDFEALKEYLVDKFLLHNFDNAKDTINLKYKKTIQENISKFAESAHKRSSVPVSTEKLISELYSSLYKVPIPKQEAIIEIVEEAKTKCEIEDWFATLQMKLKSCCNLVCQLCENQKLMGLARKLRAYELEDASPTRTREQIKLFLQRNHPQLKIEDEYIEDLVNRLNNTKKYRTFTKPDDTNNDDYSENSDNSYGKTDIQIDSNITMGPQQKIRKPADLLIDIVQRWCINLPLPQNLRLDKAKEIRNNLEANIIMEVCKLNSSPFSLNSDLLYAHLLNQEVDKMLFGIIGNVPGCDILEQNKDLIIFQLTSAIESVRPLFAEEKSKYAYEQELENKVKVLLKMRENPSSANLETYEKVKDDIIYNYLEYQCNKNSEEGKQFYRNKVVDVLKKYDIDMNNNNRDPAEYHIEANRLICELEKTSEPSDFILEEEIVETRMKHEVSRFLDKQKHVIKNKEDTNRVKNILWKELIEVETHDHSPENNQKIESVIENSLKKLDANISSTKIQAFVNRLKKNEVFRKSSVSINHNISLPANYFRSTDRQTTPRASLPNNLGDAFDKVIIGGGPIPILMPEMRPFPPFLENTEISWNYPDSRGVVQENSQMQSEASAPRNEHIRTWNTIPSTQNKLQDAYMPSQQRNSMPSTLASQKVPPQTAFSQLDPQIGTNVDPNIPNTPYEIHPQIRQFPPMDPLNTSGVQANMQYRRTQQKVLGLRPQAGAANSRPSKPSYLLPPQQRPRQSGTTAPIDTQPSTTRSFGAPNFGKQKFGRQVQPDTTQSLDAPNFDCQKFDLAAGIQTDNGCCKRHSGFKKDIDCDCECCMEEGIPPCLRPMLLPRFMIFPYF